MLEHHVAVPVHNTHEQSCWPSAHANSRHLLKKKHHAPADADHALPVQFCVGTIRDDFLGVIGEQG